MANLKTMTVAELLTLRSEVDAALQGKRDELHAQLREINGSEKPAKGLRRSVMAGKKVAAKYRHPKTGEEWSGRGGTAGWLAAEIKAGKKKESFLIAAVTRKSAVKRSKKVLKG